MKKTKRVKFSLKQKEELLQNTNIVKVNDNNIMFSLEFKIYAIKQKKLGIPSRYIFAEAGIPDWLNKREYAKHCLRRWKIANKRDKELSSEKENRGFGIEIKKTKPLPKMSEKELITKIAYLEAENDFLKKLKALETV